MSPEGRVPDFFLVGHAKSGTTALYAMLSKHPQLFLGLKEPRYFATELHERDMPRPGGTPKTLAEYRAWYRDARPEQLVGDISPDYLWSAHAPALIAEAQPQAKIIAIFREPASFLHSLHLQWLRHYVEVEQDLRKALALEGPRREGREIPKSTYWPHGLFYSDHVRYREQLRRYHELFGRERVLVLIYDDYRADNEGTVRQVLCFLGVQEDVPVATRESNPSQHVRSQRMNRALRSLTVGDGPVSGALKRSLKALTPVSVRQRALHTARKRLVLGEPPPADAQLMRELRARFAPEVRAFGEYIGRDLVSLWGYDELD